jgi:hypothetical protein
MFSCDNLNPLDAVKCPGESDPAKPTTAAIIAILTKE